MSELCMRPTQGNYDDLFGQLQIDANFEGVGSCISSCRGCAQCISSCRGCTSNVGDYNIWIE